MTELDQGVDSEAQVRASASQGHKKRANTYKRTGTYIGYVNDHMNTKTWCRDGRAVDVWVGDRMLEDISEVDGYAISEGSEGQNGTKTA